MLKDRQKSKLPTQKKLAILDVPDPSKGSQTAIVPFDAPVAKSEPKPKPKPKPEPVAAAAAAKKKKKEAPTTKTKRSLRKRVVWIRIPKLLMGSPWMRGLWAQYWANGPMETNGKI